MPDTLQRLARKSRRHRARIPLLLFSADTFAAALGISRREFSRLRAADVVPPPDVDRGPKLKRWRRRTVRAVVDRLCEGL